jgi:hypothetical protein
MIDAGGKLRMPFVEVVLKDGTKIVVPDADSAEWIREPSSADMPRQQTNLVRRLICKKAESVIARFNSEDVAGYVWHDGRAV